MLADLVEAVQETTTVGHRRRCVTSHRFGESIGALAEAVRDGRRRRGRRACSRPAASTSRCSDAVDPTADVRALRGAARPGGAPGGRGRRRRARAGRSWTEQRLLCAHREGPYGVRQWNAQVERWLGEETGEPIWSTWYAGRPLLVTANDYGLGIYNGDVGVAVRPPAGTGARALRAAIDGSAGRLDLATSRVAQVETMHALTIHKSQGSQADEVVVILPPPESRLLTRELFYTAITRAKRARRGRRLGRRRRRRDRAPGGAGDRAAAAARRPPPDHRETARHPRRITWSGAVPAARRAARRPGSLGRLATAIGEAGGDIEAIEIVEKRRRHRRRRRAARDCTAVRCPTRSSRPATRSRASRSSGSAATPPAATSSSTSRPSRS